MMRFELDISELETELRNIKQVDRKGVHEGMGYIIENEVVAQIKEMDLVDTGLFKNTVNHDVVTNNYVYIQSPVHYAAGLEFGVKPHTITPKKKRALYWKGASYPVKKVNHPGNRAYAPFRKGLQASKKKLIDYVVKKLTK